MGLRAKTRKELICLQKSESRIYVVSNSGQSHAQWGKGVNPVGLDFGDCFAYEVAKTLDCPLLYVGEDFTKTDIAPGAHAMESAPTRRNDSVRATGLRTSARIPAGVLASQGGPSRRG